MEHGLFQKILNGKFPRKSVLFLFDVLCFAAVTAFYYLISLRASVSMPVDNTGNFIVNTCMQLVFVMAARIIFGIYRNIWRYANSGAYFTLVLADAVGGAVALITIYLAMFEYYYGIWQIVTVGSMAALLSLMARFAYSLLYNRSAAPKSSNPKVPVAIAGAGRLGIYLANDLKENPNSGYDPQFFIDNDPLKIGNVVQGYSVYSEIDAVELIKKLGIREVIVAITSKSSEELSEIYDHYTSLGCRVQIYESLVGDSDSHKGRLREFTIDDLLFRKPIEYDGEDAFFYAGRTVMVTGGGGSIGSEICRQLAACHPKKLIIFDIYENNAYEIQQELVKRYGTKLDFRVVIGSVRDAARLDEVFAEYRPEIVFHAAAHKHVPLMEESGGEAIKNNCLGTYNVANAAEKYGAEKFILISTDKAVNPTNVMGASKRVCEMIVQCRTDSKTSFAAVRFGNVLGSNGSVVPLFRQQIAEGGPVTITDKRIIRYFMTIPEAS
ncbi:MAG: polysaccharide biosynthesis protein, partial [Clostridia bacterium]|nr:polysaccharide biosynthesis protein [Clostridia bacterium]